MCVCVCVHPSNHCDISVQIPGNVFFQGTERGNAIFLSVPDVFSHTTPKPVQATDKMLAACKKHNKLAGLFLFGTERVAEFLNKGFTLISIGNDREWSTPLF